MLRLLDQKLLISSISWNKTSKDENNVEAFMHTQEKKLEIYIVKVLSLGRFNWVIRETAMSLGKFPFAII